MNPPSIPRQPRIADATAETVVEVTAAEAGFWFELIAETAAADFMGVKPRTMAAWRARGGGPKFIRLSPTCVRYQRATLQQHAQVREETSTSSNSGAAA